MTKEDEKSYLSSLNKIIKSGNPKYLSYVSKEYMRFKDVDPQIALAITCMIQKEATEDKSVYAIFLDNDGSINIDSMSDISRITNVSEFVGTVEDLSGFDVDFSDMTADELIKEGEAIAEELALEAERLENEINNLDIDETTNLSVEESDVSEKSNNILVKVAAFATISAVAAAAFSRIKSVMSRISSAFSGKKNEQNMAVARKEEKIKEEENNTNNGLLNKLVKEKDESYCPIVTIDFDKAIEDTERENMLKEQKKQEAKAKGLTTDDSVDDNPADDFLDF